MAKTAAYGDKDLSAASDVWGACFGKEGNFTVIVEESLRDTSDDVEVEDKRTEFKVWSFLLTQWSPVFEKMIGSVAKGKSRHPRLLGHCCRAFLALSVLWER
eukprot:s5360_g3.t1